MRSRPWLNPKISSSNFQRSFKRSSLAFSMPFSSCRMSMIVSRSTACLSLSVTISSILFNFFFNSSFYVLSLVLFYSTFFTSPVNKSTSFLRPSLIDLTLTSHSFSFFKAWLTWSASRTWALSLFSSSIYWFTLALSDSFSFASLSCFAWSYGSLSHSEIKSVYVVCSMTSSLDSVLDMEMSSVTSLFSLESCSIELSIFSI